MTIKRCYEPILKWIIPLTVCIVICWPLLTQGGDLDPNEPPSSTMKSLDDIYNAVQDLQFAVDNLKNQTGFVTSTTNKIGFTQHFAKSSYDNIPKTF